MPLLEGDYDKMHSLTFENLKHFSVWKTDKSRYYAPSLSRSKYDVRNVFTISDVRSRLEYRS